jgi:hypothetical protein
MNLSYAFELKAKKKKNVDIYVDSMFVNSKCSFSDKYEISFYLLIFIYFSKSNSTVVKLPKELIDSPDGARLWELSLKLVGLK